MDIGDNDHEVDDYDAEGGGNRKDDDHHMVMVKATDCATRMAMTTAD